MPNAFLCKRTGFNLKGENILKIAVFTDSFLPGVGGTENALINLCRELISLGHEIILFAPDYHREQKFDEFMVYRVKSIKITPNDMAALATLEYKRVLKITKAFAPDIIYYCTAMGMPKLALKVGKKLGVPVVATIHTKFKEAYYSSTKSRFITFCVIKSLVSKLNRSAAVTTVSEDMKRELFNYGYRGEVRVIKNGTPARKIGKIEAKKIGGVPKFIFCGRLEQVKNIQFSLKCLGRLKREKKLGDFVFTVIGSGSYRGKLEKIVKKDGLAENVIFTGLVSDRSKLNEYYSDAHLLLFPSTFDNDGLGALEAAANGVPALAFGDCGAGERLTDGENGFLSGRSESAFCDKILEIIGNEELYAHVCENMHTIPTQTWREIAEIYADLFAEVASGK